MRLVAALRPDQGHPGADDLDARRVRDHVLGAQALRLRARSRRRSTTRRDRIRQAIEEAENARDEARKLLEEHRSLIGQARDRGRGDPRRGPPRRRLPARARARGDRGRPPAAPRGDAPPDRGRDAPCARADPRRGRRADARRRQQVTGKVLDDGGPPAADRGGRSPTSTSRCWRRSATRWLSRHRIYAPGAFRRRARTQGALAAVRDELDDFVETLKTCPSSTPCCATRSSTRAPRRRLLEDLLGRRDELVRNFLLLVVEKGRARRDRRTSRASSSASWRREQGILDVELTTAFELDRRRGSSIVGQIQQASGRKVEATRSVDPDLIGGLVLQAGSMRVDASVRGRLNVSARNSPLRPTRLTEGDPSP